MNKIGTFTIEFKPVFQEKSESGLFVCFIF